VEAHLELAQRIWGADAEFLEKHRPLFSEVISSIRVTAPGAVDGEPTRPAPACAGRRAARRPLGGPSRAVSPSPPELRAVVTPASQGWTFALFRGRAGLRVIAAEWARVLGTLEHPHFFQEYDWFDLILETWPADAENVFFIVASVGGTPMAICPLQTSRTRALGMPVRMLEPPDPNAISYPDFVFARTPATATLLPSLLNWLRSNSEIGWDILTIPKMLSAPDESDLADLAPDPPFFRHSRGVCYYFRCDQGIAAIQGRVSGQLRQQWRRRRRQLLGMGTMESVSSRDPAELPRLFEEFLELEASGWKGRAGEGTAIQLDPDLVRFYSGMMSRFAASGGCEINLLRLNGRNIAGQFCLISAGTWYHLKIAYDEEFHKYSPGSILLEDVLARLCLDEGVHTASLLTGAEWADRWHPWYLGVSRVIGRNHTLGGRLALQEVKARRFVRNRLIPFVRRLRKQPQ
jgi:CelD/BcsL family acetyltransferase involved in cellulose biosynthesis